MIRKSLKRQLLVLTAFVAFITVILFVSVAVVSCSKLNFPWEAGDVIAYAGAIIGSFATIAAVVLTLGNSDYERAESVRLDSLPYASIGELKHNRQALSLGLPDDEDEFKRDPVHDKIEESGQYLFIEKGKGRLCGKLTDEQVKAADCAMRKVAVGPNVTASGPNPQMFEALSIRNVGRGPAINLRYYLCPHGATSRRYLRSDVRTLASSQDILVGILVDTSKEENLGEYDLVIQYEDLSGFGYDQRFEVTVKKAEEVGCASLAINLEGKQLIRNDNQQTP